MHVAAAYNSLECMILLSNFGGMELCAQRNRYGLRALEIAEKMRNYECFEVLQKLERNVKYQNAILEREVQSLDLLKAQGRTQRVDTFGGQANYPHLKEKKVPSLKLSQTQRQPYNFNNHGTSSVERFQSEGYTQLGGYSRASERLRDFEQKSRMLQHERQYIDRQRTERFREERSERRRQSYQLEFEDYRKIPKESKTKIN